MSRLLRGTISASLLLLAVACEAAEEPGAGPAQEELAQALAGQGRIVYSAGGHVRLTNANGTSDQTLKFHPGNVSPSLMGATYVHIFPEGPAIVLARQDGSEVVLGQGSRPGVWSPDGTRLAVFLQDEERFDLWTVDAGTETMTLVVEDVVNTFGGPAWSPSGHKLAYMVDSQELMVIDLRSGDEHVVVRDVTGRIHDLAWSPDGGTIAYQRATRGPEADIVVVEASGGEPRKLGDGWWPRWSPDGSRIAYVGSTQPGLFVVDMEGTVREVVPDAVTGPTGRSQPAWSPDGEWIAYESIERAIRIANVQTGDFFVLVDQPATLLAWVD